MKKRIQPILRKKQMKKKISCFRKLMLKFRRQRAWVAWRGLNFVRSWIVDKTLWRDAVIKRHPMPETRNLRFYWLPSIVLYLEIIDFWSVRIFACAGPLRLRLYYPLLCPCFLKIASIGKPIYVPSQKNVAPILIYRMKRKKSRIYFYRLHWNIKAIIFLRPLV